MMEWSIAGMTFGSIVYGCTYYEVFCSDSDNNGVACVAKRKRCLVKIHEAIDSRLHEEKSATKREELCHSHVTVDSRFDF